MNNPIPSETKKEIAERYAAGERSTALAKEFDVNVNSVYQYYAKFFNKKPGHRHRLTLDDAREIRRLYETKEMKQAHIAQKYGVRNSLIFAIVHYYTYKE